MAGVNAKYDQKKHRLLIDVSLDKVQHLTTNGSSQVVAEMSNGNFVGKDVLKELGVPEQFWMTFRVGLPIKHGKPGDVFDKASEPEVEEKPEPKKRTTRTRKTKASE